MATSLILLTLVLVVSSRTQSVAEADAEAYTHALASSAAADVADTINDSVLSRDRRHRAHGLERGPGRARPTSSVLSESRDLRWLTILLAAAGLLAAGVTAWYAGRTVTRPIKRLTARMADIADGDGDLAPGVEESVGNEVGELGIELTSSPPGSRRWSAASRRDRPA